MADKNGEQRHFCGVGEEKSEGELCQKYGWLNGRIEGAEREREGGGGEG